MNVSSDKIALCITKQKCQSIYFDFISQLDRSNLSIIHCRYRRPNVSSSRWFGRYCGECMCCGVWLGYTNRNMLRIEGGLVSFYIAALNDEENLGINFNVLPTVGRNCNKLNISGISSFAYFIIMASQWARWRLKSSAQIKENIQAPSHWPVWGECPVRGIHRWPVNSHTNGQ